MASKKIPLSFIVIVFVILVVAGLLYFNFSDKNEIITDVDYIIDEEDVQAHWDEYKTVTVNVDRLRESLENGNVKLSLINEDVEIIITESEISNGYYRGYVNGVAANEAEFYQSENTCSCYVDLGTHSYQIAPIREMDSNEVIYVLYMIDYEKDKLRHEQYPIDPLTFEISNEDSLNHNISIEIFDPSNSLIFYENYSISPGEIIVSPEVSEVLGQHRYVVILDGDYRFEEFATVARAAELGSSEKLYFNFINNSEYPMEVAVTMA